MYLLVTVFYTDQTMKRFVDIPENIQSSSFVLQMMSSKVQSITIDKYSKAELKEMGITKLGEVTIN